MKFLLTILVFLFASAVHGQGEQNRTKGLTTGQRFDSTGPDHINTFNGNLAFTIPVGPTYPVAGTLSYGFSLSYTGSNWEYIERNAGTNPISGDERYEYFAIPRDIGNAGNGFWFTLGGRLLLKEGVWRFVSSDGSEHPFGSRLHQHRTQEPIDQNISYTSDGTYLRMIIRADGAGTVRDVERPDGTTLRFTLDGTQLLRIFDRYGNGVDIQHTTYPYTLPYGVGTVVNAPKWVITDPHAYETGNASPGQEDHIRCVWWSDFDVHLSLWDWFGHPRVHRARVRRAAVLSAAARSRAGGGGAVPEDQG